jgi:hypothetical protein
MEEKMQNVLRAALCGVALGGLVAAGAQAQETTIVTSDARFEGNTVFVPSATVSDRAFLVVHADDADQTILGHALVEPGLNENIAVTLAREPRPDEDFIVMLHEDTGIAGEFEFADNVELDRPLMIAGAPVVQRARFAALAEADEPAVVATEAAGIDVSGATHSGNVLTFSSVTIPEAGFLVIHADAPDQPMLGHAPLQAGVNQSVSVTLERDPAVGETLIAMLHEDAGIAGQFEPEIDEPLATAEGAALVGPGGEELVATAGDPVAVRFRVASGDAATAGEPGGATASGQQPAERSAAPIPEAEATGSAPSGSSGGSAGGSSGGSPGGSSGGSAGGY